MHTYTRIRPRIRFYLPWESRVYGCTFIPLATGARPDVGWRAPSRRVGSLSLPSSLVSRPGKYCPASIESPLTRAAVRRPFFRWFRCCRRRHRRRLRAGARFTWRGESRAQVTESRLSDVRAPSTLLPCTPRSFLSLSFALCSTTAQVHVSF